MFHIDISEVDRDEDEVFYDVHLRFESETFRFSFFPEEPGMIEDVDIEGYRGSIDGDPSNGEFQLVWNPEEIIFGCARFGGGNGGEMKFIVKNTEETMTSLRECLRKWKDVCSKGSDCEGCDVGSDCEGC